jgi:hypothetical protein
MEKNWGNVSKWQGIEFQNIAKEPRDDGAGHQMGPNGNSRISAKLGHDAAPSTSSQRTLGNVAVGK